MTRDDVLGALAPFLLVFVSTFPAFIQFLIVGEVATALRVSNLVAIAMVFAIGYESARCTNRNGVRSGSTMVLLGIVIVTVTVLLGG
jgi:VIT1/CCC1 family predicted Fe2+/Mn2+ transporter